MGTTLASATFAAFPTEEQKSHFGNKPYVARAAEGTSGEKCELPKRTTNAHYQNGGVGTVSVLSRGA